MSRPNTDRSRIMSYQF